MHKKKDEILARIFIDTLRELEKLKKTQVHGDADCVPRPFRSEHYKYFLLNVTKM
jgi:hypothetical protein